jgi:hypothetical protein
VSDPRARRSGPCGPPIPHRFRKQRRAGIKVPIKGLYSARRVKSPCGPSRTGFDRDRCRSRVFTHLITTSWLAGCLD